MAGHRAVLDQIDYFRNNFGTAQSRWKKDGTRVTEVDETISRELFSSLQRAFPNDDFCSEESEESETDLNGEFNWVLDPVDGTNNYAVGIPECAISLGLLKNGYPIYGFIYDYGRDIILQGGKKFGSMKNTPVASTELVNEKLTFCMHFPIPTKSWMPYMVLYRIGEYVALGRLLWDWLMSQLVAWMVAWNFAPSHGTVPPDSQSAKEQVHPMIFIRTGISNEII